MSLRRTVNHVRDQNWTAFAIDFAIVVFGVFVGLQVSLWNEARIEASRRQQIIEALVTSLDDAVIAHERFISDIDAGMSDWDATFKRGSMPDPFFYRLEGSDTAPDAWSTFQQMQVTELFDPYTLFDLMYFYSELNGIGAKYVRYVTFVEHHILPELNGSQDAFYEADGSLKPRFRTNMSRLREYQTDIRRMNKWSKCLVYRLQSGKVFKQTCRRADYRLGDK